MVCGALYFRALLEFLPVVFERLGWKRQLTWMHAIMIPLVIAGVILSTRERQGRKKEQSTR